MLAASGLSCSTWLPAGVFAQSAGAFRSSVLSTFTGVTVPLLWRVAVTVTSKALLTLALTGADTAVLKTLMSASPVTAVVALPAPLLFAAVGSVT